MKSEYQTPPSRPSLILTALLHVDLMKIVFLVAESLTGQHDDPWVPPDKSA